jgi:lysophospholipase L1-like esterase
MVAQEPINPEWEKEISRIEERELASPFKAGGVVFTGSSSIKRWSTLAQDFPGVALVNRGFGGSQLSDLIAYFDRVVLPGKPSQIVLYSGTNDVNAGELPEQVLGDFATLCGMIERELPNTKIAFISAAPNPKRWHLRENYERFNTIVALYCDRMGYDFIDVWMPMLGEDAKPTRDIYVQDQLHMNTAGYVMWRQIVAPYLVR